MRLEIDRKSHSTLQCVGHYLIKRRLLYSRFTFRIKSDLYNEKYTKLTACVEEDCSYVQAARSRKLTSRKDYTFSSLPRRITDFVRRARSQIKFSRDAGRRTIIKSKFARNRRSVEKHLTNRNGVCRDILYEKKRPRGPPAKK